MRSKHFRVNISILRFLLWIPQLITFFSKLVHSTKVAVKICIFYCSFLAENDMPCPALVYLAPSVSHLMSYTLWKYSKEIRVILYPIVPSVFKDLVDAKLQIIDKFQTNFNTTVEKNWVELFITCYRESVILNCALFMSTEMTVIYSTF